jgi:hypothetical protein
MGIKQGTFVDLCEIADKLKFKNVVKSQRRGDFRFETE